MVCVLHGMRNAAYCFFKLYHVTSALQARAASKLTFVSVKRGRAKLPKNLLYQSSAEKDWLLRFWGFHTLYERKLEPKWLVSFAESVPCVSVCVQWSCCFCPPVGGGKPPNVNALQYTTRLRPKTRLYAKWLCSPYIGALSRNSVPHLT